MALGLKGFGKNSGAVAETDAAAAAQAPQPAPAPAVPTERARAPRPPRRNRNRGWMAAGGALILIAGISAASIASSLSQSVDVLVASRPIAENAVINQGDYRVVSIAADTGSIQAISPSDAEQLIGQLASGPIGQGSILHPDQFTNRADQQIERTVVIGAALGANNLPVLDLLPGDRVRLFETFSGVNLGAGIGDLTQQLDAVAREITDGDVVASVDLNNNGASHVSIRINESNANIVANLINQGRLALVLVESLPDAAPVQPAEAGEPLEPGQPGDVEPEDG